MNTGGVCSLYCQFKEVILVGETDFRSAADHVIAELNAAGRSEATVRRQQIVLDRFVDFLTGRGLNTATDQVCVEFIANQTGVRLESLRESVNDQATQAIRRPVVLIADALAGRPIELQKSVIPAKEGCPAKFRALRDDYLTACSQRGNAEATLISKDKVVSRFLAYLDDADVADMSALGVQDLSGFFLRQRHLKRKTVAIMRSCLADFLSFLAAQGKTSRNLAERLPPFKYVRLGAEPYLWTADEVRQLLRGIDRRSSTGKRDYAMILATARLGLRISDLRKLELGDLDWRSRTITLVQQKTARPLDLPLLDDVGWAIIEYIKDGRPETACPKVFVKHHYPFDTFGNVSSIASRLSRHAVRAGIKLPADKVCGMHSLRGALAVAMIGNGTPIPVVSSVLGHASSDTTQAYYLRFDVERLRCCALDVEDVLQRAETGDSDA